MFIIQILQDTWQDGEVIQRWEYMETFDDREIAEKEMSFLVQAWGSSRYFRLVETSAEIVITSPPADRSGAQQPPAG